ncbi:hypothetical protein B0H13DRAFT_2360417 [Mycena leptocephala]|nr:hypothetical protein B0H13DRAFT_2360417 [Mycena leptocephala]
MASFNPDTTIGAYQIGVLVSYVLFGVTTTQTYIYFSRFSEDSPKLKALVAFVWVCEVAHALCIGHTLYTITISDYMHPERLAGAAPISLEMAVLFHGIIASCVQCYFAFRIYKFSQSLYIPIFCWAMSFLRMLGDIGIVVTAVPMTALGTYEVQFRWLVTALWSVSTVNDFTITATLVSLLYIQRSNAQRRTAALVDKLIVWTIETGMLTSLAGLGSLAFFVAMPENFIWLAFFTVVSRLFSNSLLALTTLRAMNDVTLPFSLPTISALPKSVQTTQTTQLSYDADSQSPRDQSNRSATEDV